MKKLLLLLAILFLGIGVFSSCNKQNDAIHKLIGTWQVVKVDTYDKDGNFTETEYASDTETLTFTETAITVTNKYEMYTVAYAYDSDNQVIRFGSYNFILKNLTANELVVINGESSYQKGEYGWDLITLKKVK